MPWAREHYPECPEPFLVGLARSGDRDAFEEIVRRRQSWLRNLMRRCCGDAALADDLSQQVLLKVWLGLPSLKEAQAFGAWMRRIAVSIWLQHLRKKDALRGADDLDDADDPVGAGAEGAASRRDAPGARMDLNTALATLSEPARLCVVLSYHEGLSHAEIATLTEIPLGTVKSHIQRGTKRLQQVLSAYRGGPDVEEAR